MVFFPNEEMELWEYKESVTDYTSYHDPKKEYQLVTTIPCDFQPMSPKDSLSEFGEILEDTFKIYADLDVPVNSSMIIRLKDKPDTYEITGTPNHNNHLLPVHHKKIIVQKQRKPLKLGDE